MADLSGQQFGPYQIIEPLGEGGMATVYKAHQPAMERTVALKVLSDALAAEAEFAGRFRQEARLLANLQHPHILPIFDYGERDDVAYIVMPYVQSGTLADRLRGQPLPFDSATRMARQIAEALDYAHSRGLVHRDIKPSNILLDERGNCLLTDFGIAKLFEATSGFTSTGGIIGTPSYMAPEQGQGSKVDRRCDIYSLGVLLYEMVTGRVPFAADTPIAVVLKHITEPLPPPRQLNPAIPPRLEQIILMATAKQLEERFQTARAFIAALEGDDDLTIVSGAPAAEYGPALGLPPPAVQDVTSDSRSRARWFALGGAILLIMALGLGAGFFLALPDAAEPTATSAPQGPPIVQGDDESQADQPSPTPTGQGDEATEPTTEATDSVALAQTMPPTPAASDTPDATPTPAVTPTPSRTPPPLGPETIELGLSAGGRPIEAVRFGNGPNAVVFVGGIHAGFAPNSVRLAQNVVQHFTDNPGDVPATATVYIILSMNPDSDLDPGFLPGRLNDNGVDLNRNWDCAWMRNPEVDNRTIAGAGGAGPFSEPETQAVSEFLLEIEPRAVIFWEARAVPGLVIPGACGSTSAASNPLAVTYAQSSGYRWVAIDGASGVDVPGDASNWLDQQGIPSAFAMLPSFTEPDWNNNLNGMLAVIRQYGR